MRESTNLLNDRYQLLQRAGAGGMATVYKGQDLKLGRVIAVKVLHESLTNDAEFLRRFQQEAHSAANLAHPNLVTVHDIGQDERQYYIVMEYVEGWTLKELIHKKFEKTDRPLGLDLTLDLAIQSCAGIGYADRAGLVHCDVKSQNILVTKDHRVKVTDFGIARALSETSVQDADFVWGTPQYFSPEQAAGKAATPASDVYSIGVIMFEMLAARLPFRAESHTALALKHLQEPPPLVSAYNPGVPQQIERIITKVLSKEPGGRYRTADQLGRVLTTYRENSLHDTGPIAVAIADPADTKDSYFSEPILNSTPVEQTLQSYSQEPVAREGDTDYYPVPEHSQGTDWTVIALGLLALISLLGLIPLWYFVYIRYTGL